MRFISHCPGMLLCAVGFIASIQPSQAAITNLTPTADTTIHDTFPDNNFGGGASFTAGGRNQGGYSRALLHFDIAASLPAGAVVNSAELRLNVITANGAGSTFDLNRLLAAWGEGNGSETMSGSPGEPGEATWNNRLGPGTPWDTAGGDFTATASASQDIANEAPYTFASTGLAADIQTWLDDPDSNFGWLLRSQSETSLGTIRRFSSRLDPVNPPVLVVDYTVPETPATPPVLLSPVQTENQFQFSFAAESNRTYAVEFLGALPGTNWTILTNIPAHPANATLLISDPLTSSNRLYRVRTP